MEEMTMLAGIYRRMQEAYTVEVIRAFLDAKAHEEEWKRQYFVNIGDLLLPAIAAPAMEDDDDNEDPSDCPHKKSRLDVTGGE